MPAVPAYDAHQVFAPEQELVFPSCRRRFGGGGGGGGGGGSGGDDDVVF